MLVDVIVANSRIHGKGLFARQDIAAGSILWMFLDGDSRTPKAEASEEVMHFGYINPQNPDFVVVCGDCARYWNFGLDGAANCGCSDTIEENGECAIIALRDIAMGEELLITVDSDADACRKLGELWHASDKE